MERAALFHDPLVTPDGVWALPVAARLGTALTYLSAARVAVNLALSRDAIGDAAEPSRQGVQDPDQHDHALGGTRGSATTFTTTQLKKASTDRMVPETLHGDAPLSVGVFLLPRSATTCTADIDNGFTQPGDGELPGRLETIDPHQGRARDSPQSPRLNPRPDDAFIAAEVATRYGTIHAGAALSMAKSAQQGSIQILQHREPNDAPRAGDADTLQQQQLNRSTADATLDAVVRESAALLQNVQGHSPFPLSFPMRSRLPECENTGNETQSFLSCITTSAGASPPASQNCNHVALPLGNSACATSGGGDNLSLGQTKPKVEQSTGNGDKPGDNHGTPPESIITVGDINQHILGPLISLCHLLPSLYDTLCLKLTPQFIQLVKKEGPLTPVLVYLRKTLASRAHELAPRWRGSGKKLRGMAHKFYNQKTILQQLYKGGLVPLQPVAEAKIAFDVLVKSMGDLLALMGALKIEGFTPKDLSGPTGKAETKTDPREDEVTVSVPSESGVELVAHALRFRKLHPGLTFIVPKAYDDKDLFAEKTIKLSDMVSQMGLANLLTQILSASSKHNRDMVIEKATYIADHREAKRPYSHAPVDRNETLKYMERSRVTYPEYPPRRSSYPTVTPLPSSSYEQPVQQGPAFGQEMAPAFTLQNVMLNTGAGWVPFNCNIADVMEQAELGLELKTILTNDKGKATMGPYIDPNSMNSLTIPFKYTPIGIGVSLS